MAVNLFVTIPANIPEPAPTASSPAYRRALDGPSGTVQFWLTAHIVMGLALVVAALANLAWSSGVGTRRYTVASFVGSMAIVGAAFNGASFVNYGHDFSSMIMAGLWASASASYLTCMYIAAQSQWNENARVVALPVDG